ncbi:TonB-dependent outer membrane protein, SusC/RagA [Gemmatirosa kalamazoonensis]|uniref:TonB-dependent outer membrane protein, SusC/RagA n=1 Tax=Gemmatirosa kalamazoonensis TaxID=861299 RepID=W0RBR5_9BACT|nr:TonB-dependent receptor [Gemmatirosa kalamazoonensis]AHG87897.1 TonB-dependent outer membrane protein, SusC/RagA [Gemmatirosa kalamazoonensis]
MTFRSRAVVAATLLGTLVATTHAHAQVPTGSIAGRVTNATTQTPIVGARVSVVGTTRQAVTREDGRFVITAVPTGSQRVRVAVLGYSAQEQPVAVTTGGSATLAFALQPAAVQLSEIVTVGYGTQRRADLTGSVASVATTELQQTTVNTLEQGLQGRVAGVQVTQGDAAPGGGMRVQIRGVNSMNGGSAQPLYVIDGVPVASSGTSKIQGGLSQIDLRSTTETNPLAQIAPEDIESIDILKDASATAIYGSRGANGVVLITTKKGTRDRAGQYTFNLSQGVSSVVRQIDVLNAFDFATYVNTAFINAFGPQTQYPYGGRPGSQTPDSIRNTLGNGTNWQDAIFRNAPVTDGTLGFSGGDDKGSYALSGNLLQQAGVIRGSEFKRGGLRLNLDRSVSDRFRVTPNVALTRSVNNMVRSSTINGWNAIGIVRGAVTYVPFQFRDTTQADPRAESPTVLSQYGSNPLRYTDEVHENDQITRGIGGVRGVLKLGHGFSFDENLGANYERRTYGAYFPSTVNEGRLAKGDAISNGSEFGNLLTESLVRYEHEISGRQRIDALGGFTWQNDKSTWQSQEVQGFPNDILGGNVLQNGTQPQLPYSGLSTSQLASWLGRVNYSLNDRYLFTATIRADGSSKFASNNKWATFPAFAFAWKAIDEPFLKHAPGLSDLKVRLSYGKSGNQAIGAYQSLPAISGVAMTLNETIVPAYVVTQLGNPNLRWETTSQFDGGVDFGLFDNRFTGTVDVYRKNTYDLLQQITLAQNTGFSSAWINSGNVTNRGVELQAAFDVIQSNHRGGLSWNISANASHNTNRIASLGNGIKQQFAGNLGAGGNLEVTPFIQKPGLPIGAMWGYVTDGLVRTPQDSVAYSKILGSAAWVGDLKYKDLNGDGKINADDQTVIGDANPKWVYGVTNTLRVGRFDLSALVTAVRGNSILNTERMRYLTLDGTINIPREFYDNAFDPKTNPDGKYPIIRQNRKADARFHDLFLEDGSYVRLKNVQLGYNIKLPGARTAHAYVNGVNLLTWTNYTGFDPEVSAFSGTNRMGVDLGSYPLSRIVTFGINTTF